MIEGKQSKYERDTERWRISRALKRKRVDFYDRLLFLVQSFLLLLTEFEKIASVVHT